MMFLWLFAKWKMTSVWSMVKLKEELRTFTSYGSYSSQGHSLASYISLKVMGSTVSLWDFGSSERSRGLVGGIAQSKEKYLGSDLWPHPTVAPPHLHGLQRI